MGKIKLRFWSLISLINKVRSLGLENYSTWRKEQHRGFESKTPSAGKCFGSCT